MGDGHEKTVVCKKQDAFNKWHDGGRLHHQWNRSHPASKRRVLETVQPSLYSAVIGIYLFQSYSKKGKDDELSFANRSFAGEMAFLILTTLVLLSILIYDFVGDHVAWGLDSLIWISVGLGELVYVTVFELVETNKISSPHGG